MTKKTIWLFIVFLGIYTASLAQPNAKEIMNKVSSVFNRDGGIRIDFSAQFLLQGRQKGNSRGHICIKANRFALHTPEASSWFNGSTLWSYLSSSEEVNVSTPSQEELFSINPYLILNNYRKNYNCALGSRKQFQQQPIHEIILTPLKPQYDIAAITLYIDSKTYRTLFIEVMQNNGYTSRFTIKTYQTQQSFTNQQFEFDARQYPSAEIIDLR